MNSPLRSFFAVALSLVLIAPVFAFDTRLSDEAIRDAYFLGQHRDKSMADVLAKYVQFLPPPESGPYVYSVTFFTPYALAVLDSSRRSMNYSAQQAELDHRNQQEIVRVIVQVQLTDSYGPYLMQPTGSRSGSPVGISFRPSDFWKDFRVHVLNGDKEDSRLVIPLDAAGQPTYRCDDSSCTLSGAALTFDFPADSFTSDSSLIRVDPPEGASVSLSFDITSFR